MKNKLFAALAVAALLSAGTALRAQDDVKDAYVRAVDFYEHGMFERAQTLFGEIASRTGDVLAKGYEALCSVRQQEKGSEAFSQQFIDDYPYSRLVPQIHFYRALNLFDNRDYKAAAREFSRVDESRVFGDQVAEYSFKKAYALFELGELDEAKEIFGKSERMPHSDYTAPSRYSLGYINYSQKNFKEAFDWFEKAGKDPRFTEISDYYMTECKFMQKDYNYVIRHGEKIYPDTPKERQPHLAKMISESFLAKDDPEKAKQYFDKIDREGRELSSADLFYAGSVLYATRDFAGAVENFSKMTDRTDSIGQIANYELGFSCIQTGNKVAAMEAFKDASRQEFNRDIAEDAHFNYAKLSFDLNHNPSVFEEYMKKYPHKDRGDQIYSYMALASLYNRDYAGAVDAYSNIDNLDKDQRSNYMKANYLRARQLVGNGSWRDAIPLLKAAGYYSPRQDGFNQLTRYWLAESYYRSDQYDNAVEAFKELYNNSALDGKTEGRLIPYDLAYSYFRKEDYDNAAKWFDEYLGGRNLTEGEDAACRRADCDFQKKDYAAAIKGYENAMKRFAFSDNLYPRYKAGIAYGLLDDKSGKVGVLSKALDADPSAEYYSEALYELGRAYVSAGNPDQAVKCFKTLRVNTTDKAIAARSLIELGMIARNKSRNDQALTYYKQVIEEMPGTEYSRDALLAIESIYQSDGRADEYLDYAEKIGATGGKTELERDQMYFNAAEQLYLTENYNKALTSLQNYLERFPDGKNKGMAEYYTADCYRFLGKKEAACDWYTKAIEEDGNQSYLEPAMLNFSRLSYDLQHYADAYGGFSRLLENARIDGNKHAARLGMMRSAFHGQEYSDALSCADLVKADALSTQDEAREADYVKAKSYLMTNERTKAFAIFKTLAAKPSTPEGAEAAYMMIQDAYDQGRFNTVESMVYDFAGKAGDQSYWLAKAFIVLGDTFAELGNLTQAKATFESVKNGYTPEGDTDDVLDAVEMRLAKLKNLKK